MKITIINKKNTKINTMSICPWLVDQPPVGSKEA